ncbi:hypothetical protein DPSP01_005558 [Paraphaeosphaeria sporulosa]
MSVNILNLLSEAKGEAPVKFTTTFAEFRMVSPSAEKRAAQPKPEPTTAESVTEKQAPNKDKKDPSEITDAYRKFVAAKAVITKNKQLAKAPAKAEAEPKTRLEVLYAQHIRAPKRAKAPQVTRKPVLEFPKKAGTKAEDLFKQQTDNVDAEDSDAFTDAVHLALIFEHTTTD